MMEVLFELLRKWLLVAVGIALCCSFLTMFQRRHPISSGVNTLMLGGLYIYFISDSYGDMETKFSSLGLVGVWALSIAGIVLSVIYMRKKLKSSHQD